MYNKISLMGRLTHTPELKMTQNGIPFVRFRIAVNRRYHAKGENAAADFFNVVAWRGTAEFICKYFGKGNMIMLDGEMQSTPYTDKNSNPSVWWEVAIDRVCFTGETRRDNDRQSGYNSGKTVNTRSSGNRNGNAYEQAQRIYGKPPVNNGYGQDYGGEPSAVDDYPF